MLTKDMVKFSRRGEYIRPFIISVDDEESLKIAAEMLSIYCLIEGQPAPTRGEIAQLAEPIINDANDIKVAKGLQKIILDNCEFAIPRDFDYATARHEIFTATAGLLKSGSRNDPDEFCSNMRQLLPQYEALISSGIYTDLPENESLIKVKQIFPKELLERYNCAQVQSLLLRSKQFTLCLSDVSPVELRRTFKYLKFFRLLADIYQLPPDKIEIIISGPATILENTKKYGLQLATFFPAVCLLKKWSVKADIEYNGRIYKLRINQESKLNSHYHNFSAYIPEEITIFHRLFRDKKLSWEIVGETPCFHADNNEVIFPDLSFKHISGTIIHLELFHRWHAGALIKRLDFCTANQNIPLLLGVDNALIKNPETKQLLDDNCYFAKKGFYFRDFPNIERICKLLDTMI
jgi:predicted nuclease of restriction endonuclease-like RecB superfamily